jgi:uncharacterized protein involved in tolerance to divalent cations
MRLVWCSFPGEFAEPIARTVTEQGFAACVNLISGVKRAYPAENEAQFVEETLLLIQTGKDELDEMFKLIADRVQIKPLPIISLDIFGGSSSYLDWAQERKLPDQREDDEAEDS